MITRKLLRSEFKEIWFMYGRKPSNWFLFFSRIVLVLVYILEVSKEIKFPNRNGTSNYNCAMLYVTCHVVCFGLTYQPISLKD